MRLCGLSKTLASAVVVLHCPSGLLDLMQTDVPFSNHGIPVSRVVGWAQLCDTRGFSLTRVCTLSRWSKAWPQQYGSAHMLFRPSWEVHSAQSLSLISCFHSLTLHDRYLYLVITLSMELTLVSFKHHCSTQSYPLLSPQGQAEKDSLFLVTMSSGNAYFPCRSTLGHYKMHCRLP